MCRGLVLVAPLLLARSLRDEVACAGDRKGSAQERPREDTVGLACRLCRPRHAGPSVVVRWGGPREAPGCPLPGRTPAARLCLALVVFSLLELQRERGAPVDKPDAPSGQACWRRRGSVSPRMTNRSTAEARGTTGREPGKGQAQGRILLKSQPLGVVPGNQRRMESFLATCGLQTCLL